MRDLSVGTDLTQSELWRRLRETGPGVFKGISILDGKERIYSAVRLDGLPFYLVVGQITSEIYADWNVRAAVLATLLLSLCATLGCLALTLDRELRRRRHAEKHAMWNAEDARAAAAELELVTDNTDDLIMKLDWKGHRSFVSPASERLLGYHPSELLHGDATAFVHPDDKVSLQRLLAELQGGEKCIAQISYRVQHRSGEWRSVEARCRAVPDGSGAIVAVRDVTERTELEAKLRQAQKMEGIGQLTAGVAHDFNNMLQGQIAGLELLQDRVAGDAAAALLASRAIDLAEKGARLTHSLLAFARKQVLRPEPVDLVFLLSELNALLSRTLGPKVTLEMHIEPRLGRPLADPTQLEAALLNLCLNARDAMGADGGRIRIQASGKQEFDGSPNERLARDFVVITVTDDGGGMTPDVMARVCEPFFTTKAVGQGSGLGLSMVQGFAQQSGGELLLQSTVGVGTCATMRLPASPDTAPAPHGQTGRTTRVHPTSRRLLLVDDDPSVLENLAQALEFAGYVVTAVSNGAEALEILRSTATVDVLITDFGMPGMAGGHLIRFAQVLRPGLHTLLMTGYVDLDLADGLPPDVVVLHKPFRLEQLLEKLTKEPELAEAVR